MPRRRRIPSPHVITALAVILGLVRHRKPLQQRLHHILFTISRILHSVYCSSAILSHTTSDLLHYLRAPTPTYTITSNPSPTCRSRPAARASARSVPTTLHSAHPSVPRSLRRLLHLAASPDGTSILHSLSAGCTSALLSAQHACTTSGTPPAPALAVSLVDALASSSGRVVVSTAVTSAVRELMRGAASPDNLAAQTALPAAIVNALADERGRRLVVDVAEGVTRVAVPAVLQSAALQERRDEPALSPRAGENVGRSEGVKPGAGDSGAVAHSLVERMVVRGRGASFWERLAVLAIRDRVLVQEVVRVVVGQAVRTYLITQAELRRGDVGAEGSVADDGGPEPGLEAESAGGSIVDRTKRRGLHAAEHGSSVWKMLARSVAADVKRLLHRVGSRDVGSGWMVF